MEMRDVAADVTSQTDGQLGSKPGSGVDIQTQRRVVKPTAKALADKLDRLQNGRKNKLNKASAIKRSMHGLMSKGDKTEVQNALDEFIEVCEDAKSMHESLLVLLPGDEKEKHKVWFKAKMLSNNECIADAKRWVSCNEGDQNEFVDDINPEDSVSNVGSKWSSQRSGKSGKLSTTSSARLKAEAKRAALMAQAAALKARHALEEEELQLKRKKEQLEMETKLAASAAMLAVFKASDLKSSSQAP